MTKTCTKCSQDKSVDEFSQNAKSRDGRHYWCKTCSSDANKRRYVSETPEKRQVRQANERRNRLARQANGLARGDTLRRRYKITASEFEALLAEQDGKCAVCKLVEPTVVDHDHACCPGTTTCGQCLRGLLCVPCNLLLGAAKDNAGILYRASEYLSRGSRVR